MDISRDMHVSICELVNYARSRTITAGVFFVVATETEIRTGHVGGLFGTVFDFCGCGGEVVLPPGSNISDQQGGGRLLLSFFLAGMTVCAVYQLVVMLK